MVLRFDLLVCGMADAAAAAGRFAPTHMVALLDRGLPLSMPASVAAADFLLLRMSDTVCASARQGPNRGQALALLAFGRRVGDGARLMVCCEAGKSRSTAAAYLLAAQALGAGSARAALAAVLEARPGASPNPRLVALGAEALGMPELEDVLREHGMRMMAETLAAPED